MWAKYLVKKGCSEAKRSQIPLAQFPRDCAGKGQRTTSKTGRRKKKKTKKPAADVSNQDIILVRNKCRKPSKYKVWVIGVRRKPTTHLAGSPEKAVKKL